MLKRKYGDRTACDRHIISKQYTQCFLEDPLFTGYITLNKIIEVTSPYVVSYGDENYCLADNGYIWLQQFPANQNHSTTSIFNSKGEIVQWIVDICCQKGVTEKNIPWMEDLYIDLIVLSTNKIMIMNTTELQKALELGDVNKLEYHIIWDEVHRLIKAIKMDRFDLFKLSTGHLDMLLAQL